MSMPWQNSESCTSPDGHASESTGANKSNPSEHCQCELDSESSNRPQNLPALKKQKKNVDPGPVDGASHFGPIYGVNYEGGKIMTHIKQNPNCIAAFNAQIAMDAPWCGEVADESLRNKMRAELAFPDYDEPETMRQLGQVFAAAERIRCRHDPANTNLVIQIARGRSTRKWKFQEDVIDPILKSLNIDSGNVIVKDGYRSTDYYVQALASADGGADSSTDSSFKFVFVNVGMFARLYKSDVKVGTVCLPTKTGIVVNATDIPKTITNEQGETEWAFPVQMKLYGSVQRFQLEKNAPIVLGQLAQSGQCEELQNTNTKPIATMTSTNSMDLPSSGREFVLLGVGDHFPFVTPKQYRREDFLRIIEELDNA